MISARRPVSAVPDLLGVDDDVTPLRALIEAAGALARTALQAALVELLLEGLAHLLRALARRSSPWDCPGAPVGADEDVALEVRHGVPARSTASAAARAR